MTKLCAKCGAEFAVQCHGDRIARHCPQHRQSAAPNRGIRDTIRRCAAPGCRVEFSPERGSSIYCRSHRWRKDHLRPDWVPPVQETAAPVAMPTPTRCAECGDPLNPFEAETGRCLECTPLRRWA